MVKLENSGRKIKRVVPFHLGTFGLRYRKSIIEPNEVVVNILIPFTEKVTTLVPVPFIINFSDTRRWAKYNL